MSKVAVDETVNGRPSFTFITQDPGRPVASLEKGINPMAATKGSSKSPQPKPAILISSSPHSRGTEWNPWHDVFEPDLGYVRYFGDAKSAGDPSLAPGNKVLLEAMRAHTSGDREIRESSTPLILFERVASGILKFQGFGIVERAELVTQYNPAIGYFTNYVFTFAVLSLSEEDEELNWDWIRERRDATLDLKSQNRLAPNSWKMFVRLGVQRVESFRRRAALAKVEPPQSQMPEVGSREHKALREIYDFYSTKGKHRFELLASRVVMSVVNSNGGNYLEGWVTKGSGDGGVDFVGKIRLGGGFGSVDVIVLGQAKCEALDKPTNGVALARTVARLKRGWIGAYVTTSYFSKPSQIEVIEDSYPLLLVSGLQLAQETLKLAESGGYSSVLGLLDTLELEYPDMIHNRRPDEILDL
ncbi:MAG: restriction endonuclease [Actinomycetales bacterium]|nr:restriction endonuclease [Actinomycetales bacterium]